MIGLNLKKSKNKKFSFLFDFWLYDYSHESSLCKMQSNIYCLVSHCVQKLFEKWARTTVPNVFQWLKTLNNKVSVSFKLDHINATQKTSYNSIDLAFIFLLLCFR
jgi:hypothetical protein